MAHTISYGLTGPGSQPGDEDGSMLDYMQMPSGMATFATPHLPEPEEAEALDAGKAVLARVLGLLKAYENDGAHNIVDLAGVFNAPPLLSEINEHIPAVRPGRDPHVINLSLLPHTEEDLRLIDACLGRGPLTILSRGYGNCRVTSTARCQHA